jgi:hypothetical protein
MAAQAIWVYYMTSGTVINDARFRWAQKAIQYDANSGVTPTHTVSNSQFDQCTIGIQNNMPSASVSVSGTKQCGTTTPLYGSFFSGSMSPDCGDTAITYDTPTLTAKEHESVIVVDPNYPNRVVMFAAHQPAFTGLVKVVSTDGGQTWGTPSLFATGSDFPSAEGDPSACFDQYGNLFLTYLYTEVDFVVLLLGTFNSTTQNYDFVRISSPKFDGGTSGVDRPIVAAGPRSCGGGGSVWMLYVKNGNLTLGGAYVDGPGANNVNTFSYFTPACDVNPPTGFAHLPSSLAVSRCGAVAFAYESNDDANTNHWRIYVSVDSDGLGTNANVCRLNQTVNLQMPKQIPAQQQPGILRNPSLAWDRRQSGTTAGRLYLAYTDAAGTASNDTDIYVQYSTDGGTNWQTRLKVNSTSNTSQFMPGLAVDQTTGNVAVSWYDCRNDTVTNKLTHFFAVVSENGFSAGARNFQLNPLQSDGTANSCSGTDINYGDYTGLAFHGGYFYPSFVFYGTAGSSRCPKIHTCRIPW